MKKKQNIQFLKKNIKLFLLCLIFTIACIAANSQNTNPFINSNKPKGNPYASDKRTILIVFDASGSMEDKIQGETKIHIAKRVLEDVLEKADSDLNLGLRVYGASNPTGNPYYDCSDSKLVIIPAINNRRSIISEIYKILPRGFTPITYSLSQAVEDLQSYKGEKSILLISDGLETCGGEPCLLAKNLSASNIDLKIDVVGFGVKDDWEAKQQLMCIALNTKGRYFSAENDDELTRSISESINKSVTGRIITMVSTPIEVQTKETEGYENLPVLQPEKLILKRKK
ncbi:MAG: VWA domain-containing protein [Candidatus Melainabacteria bacterium]|nr:VWA domain-containing protein [Candidatus Melainabacteria bacterium]